MCVYISIFLYLHIYVHTYIDISMYIYKYIYIHTSHTYYLMLTSFCLWSDCKIRNLLP